MRHEIDLTRYGTGQRVPDPKTPVGKAEIAFHAAWDKAQDAAQGQPAKEAASACLDALKEFREALQQDLEKPAEISQSDRGAEQ